MQNVHNLFIDNYGLLWYTIGTETDKDGKGYNNNKLLKLQLTFVSETSLYRWTRKRYNMEVYKIIDILRLFHESKPTAKIDRIEEIDDGAIVRLWWYVDNDGGHIDLYL